MEIQITKDEANAIMKQRGYSAVSHNESGGIITKINYVRLFPVNDEQGMTLYSTVNLVKATIDLSFITMKRACQLIIPSLAYDHKLFEEFEQILLIYAAKCSDVSPFTILDSWLSSVPKREEAHVDDLWPDDAAIEAEFNKIVQEAITAPPVAPEPEQPKSTKKTIKERKRAFWDALAPIAKQRGWDKPKTVKFYEYWTEENKSGTKFRRENENFFDINKRMATFDRIDNERMGNRKSFADQKAEKQTAELKKASKVIQTKNVF